MELVDIIRERISVVMHLLLDLVEDVLVLLGEYLIILTHLLDFLEKGLWLDKTILDARGWIPKVMNNHAEEQLVGVQLALQDLNLFVLVIFYLYNHVVIVIKPIDYPFNLIAVHIFSNLLDFTAGST